MPKAISTLVAGNKVKDKHTKHYGEPIVWRVVAKSHTGYPVNSVTLLSDNIIRITLFDASEPTNPDTYRKDFGNPRYLYSNIRQWLNSKNQNWYTARHTYDAPPNSGYNAYYNVAGFLSDFSWPIMLKLLDTTFNTKCLSIDGSGTDVITDKVFLFSTAEMGSGETGEGAAIAYFNTTSTRLCTPTAQAVDNSEYKNNDLATTLNYGWWLRTATPGLTAQTYANIISSTGSYASNERAYSHKVGLRPAFNISSDVLVSDTVDTDGAYIMLWPPVISGADTNLGALITPPTISFTLDERVPSDFVTVVVSLDGSPVWHVGNVTLGQEYSYTLTASQFLSTSNGQPHTIKITATNQDSISTTRTYTFTRVVNAVDIQLVPQQTGKVAEQAIVIPTCLADPANVAITVSNNALDTAPAWEIAKQGVFHKFANKVADGNGAISARAVITPTAGVPNVYCSGLSILYF